MEECSIASEFTTGEQYVVVSSEKWAAEIEEIWQSTVGEYLKAEREWRKRQPKGGRVAGEEDLAATEIQDALEDSDGENEEDGAESAEEEEDEGGTDELGRSGQLRGAQTLARLLQRLPSPDPLGVMSKESSRRARRRISSSSSENAESSPQGVRDDKGPRSPRVISKEREKPAFTPKFKLRKDNYRWRVDGLIKAKAVDDGKEKEDDACLDEMSLLFRSMMQMEREEEKRAEQELAREREDALGQDEPDRTLSISSSPSSPRLHTSIHPQPIKGTVIEVQVFLCFNVHTLLSHRSTLVERIIPSVSAAVPCESDWSGSRSSSSVSATLVVHLVACSRTTNFAVASSALNMTCV